MTAAVTRLPTAAKRKVRAPHLTGAQLADRGIRRILPEPAWVDPRAAFSAEMMIAQAILDVLTPEQKREAQNAVHRLFCETGTNASRAASAFMASV